MYITFLDKESLEVVTLSTDTVTEKNLASIDKMLPHLYYLYEKAEKILEEGNLNKRYKTTYIPKQSGGKRRVDEPDEELKEYMREVVDVFTNKFNLIFPQSAYAYIKSRSTKQLVESHKDASIIIKLDIKDFFHNCSLKFIMNAMEKVYPFCIMDITILETIVKACMLKYEENYGLPQGAPTSPMLSNIAMIPIDFYFSKKYSNYTRFSDDIVLSLKKREMGRDSVYHVQEKIESWIHFENNQFILNKGKSKVIKIEKSGGAWVLGIMINKNHDVTIGSKNKQILKSIIFSFLMDVKNGNIPDKAEVYEIIGRVGYYKYIEPEYVKMIIQKYEDKTGLNYHKEIANIIYS